VNELSIPTRQDAEVLFQTQTPLKAGASFTTGVQRVSGYAQIEILAISDQSFTIQVLEAVTVDQTGKGHFVQIQSTLSSVVVGTQQVISTRIPRFGHYMKMVLVNGATPETELSFAAQGLPLN